MPTGLGSMARKYYRSNTCTISTVRRAHAEIKLLTQGSLDVCWEFSIAQEAIKEIVAHKVCGVRTAMTYTGMATFRPGGEGPPCRQVDIQ